MLPKLKHFFETHFVAETGASEVDSDHALRLAMASLMIEVAESDFNDAPEEREALTKVVRDSFDLEESEAIQIIDLAKQEHAESTDYFQFTKLINQNYSAEEKIQLIENLWKIAYSDKTLHKYEEHVIRRIADLIYVSHSDFMTTKLRVKRNITRI